MYDVYLDSGAGWPVSCEKLPVDGVHPIEIRHVRQEQVCLYYVVKTAVGGLSREWLWTAMLRCGSALIPLILIQLFFEVFLNPDPSFYLFPYPGH